MKHDIGLLNLEMTPGVEVSVSADEAEELGAFVEDALSEEDAKAATEDTQEMLELREERKRRVAVQEIDKRMYYLITHDLLELGDQNPKDLEVHYMICTLMEIEFFKLIIAGIDENNELMENVLEETAENSMLTEEQKEIAYGLIIIGMYPNDVTSYSNMTLEELEHISELIQERLDFNK